MFASHSRRSENEMVSKLVLWTSQHGQRKQDRPVLNYINTLTTDTGMETAEMEILHEGEGYLEIHRRLNRQTRRLYV